MARIALHLVLVVLARAMSLMSWGSSHFRAALSRDRVIALATKDGAAFHFIVSGRRIWGRRGKPARADFTLTFTSSRQALACLLSPASVGKVLNGVLDGTIEHEGSLVLLLWFDGRVQQIVPLREPIRLPARFPGACVTPPQDAAAAQTTREPAVEALDADWAAAWTQRNKLVMVRVAAGGPEPEF